MTARNRFFGRDGTRDSTAGKPRPGTEPCFRKAAIASGLRVALGAVLLSGTAQLWASPAVAQDRRVSEPEASQTETVNSDTVGSGAVSNEHPIDAPRATFDGIVRIDGRIVIISGPSHPSINVLEQMTAVGRALVLTAIAADPEAAFLTDNAALEALDLLSVEEQGAFLREEYPNAPKRFWEISKGEIGHALKNPVNVPNPFDKKRLAEAARERVLALAEANNLVNPLPVRILCYQGLGQYDLDKEIIPLNRPGGKGNSCSGHIYWPRGVQAKTTKNFNRFPDFIEMSQDAARDLYAQNPEWPPFIAFDANAFLSWEQDIQNRPILYVRFSGGEPYWLADRQQPEKALFKAEPVPQDLVDLGEDQDLLAFFQSALPIDPRTMAPTMLFDGSGRSGLVVAGIVLVSDQDRSVLNLFDVQRVMPEDPLVDILGVPASHLIEFFVITDRIDRVIFVLPAPRSSYTAPRPPEISNHEDPYALIELEIGAAWTFDINPTSKGSEPKTILVASARPQAGTIMSGFHIPKAKLKLNPVVADLVTIFSGPMEEEDTLPVHD
jgi:hypothetical protein